MKIVPNGMLRGASILAICLFASAVQAQQVTLSLLTDVAPEVVARAEALVADFEAANPDISIEMETRPGGAEGDNLIKTRLATQSMTDLFVYNSGSKFQSINPDRLLVDLSAEPWQADIQPSFKTVVTSIDGAVRGAPFATSSAGGIFYNTRVYAELGLEVPKSWEQFMANNQTILDAGEAAPVIQTYKDAWTSQILLLGDYFNVQAAKPDFAKLYTEGQEKFATEPTALRSFEKLQELHDAGFLNENYASAGYDDGLRMLANGEGVHYPITSGALRAIATTYPDLLGDIGFFPIPGDNAEINGLTVWMPQAVYIPNTTSNLDAAKKFVAFVASPAGCEALKRAGGGSGPFLVAGCELENAPPAVSDMLPFFENGHNSPALEFLSPIKGPALEQITVSVGSGIMTAAEGAALYDEDVRKQAQQLGLPGW